jgi:hypothetical protein
MTQGSIRFIFFNIELSLNDLMSTTLQAKSNEKTIAGNVSIAMQCHEGDCPDMKQK